MPIRSIAIVLFSTLCLGTIVQSLLWISEDTDFVGALVTKPQLWIAYLVVGLLVAERIHRLLNKVKRADGGDEKNEQQEQGSP